MRTNPLRTLTLGLTLIAISFATHSAKAEPDAKPAVPPPVKVLVAYYSLTGNTSPPRNRELRP
jgi:hypothetical protein